MNYLDEIKKRVIVFDGAMGTEIQKFRIKEASNEWLNIQKPDIIEKIHRSYCEAGADCLETNTFNSSKIRLKEFGKEKHAKELTISGVQLAKKIARMYNVFVAGSMGPTGFLPSSSDSSLRISVDELEESYFEHADALIH